MPTTLPPGPRHLPKLLQTFLIFGNTIPYMRYAKKRYGDPFTIVGLPMGELVYVSDPQVIKEVFAGDPDVFRAGEGNMVLADILGTRSVLTLDGDEHLNMRKLLLPPFHGKAIARYEQLITDLTIKEVESWPTGKPIKLHKRMQALTLEVILQAVFGVTDEARLAPLRPRLRRLAHLDSVITMMWMWPRLERYGPWKKYRALQAEVDELLYEEIRLRREATDLEDRADVLSMLVAARRADGTALTERELRDQCITLLMAGHETTATGLAWAFERLMRTPDAMSSLTDEIDTAESDDYLNATVKETLRIRPVIADVARHLHKPARVAGYDLPAGVTVMPAVALVHYDEANYPDADSFRPERWLEGDPPPYTWLPFGGGRRRCLGASLATLEMKTILRETLKRVELTAPDPKAEKIRVFHITQIPGKGAQAIVQTRATRPDDSARVSRAKSRRVEIPSLR
jgi:cytochrome P450